MHLFAWDETNQLVETATASKQKIYFCRECRSPVKLRGGFLRQRHFYHLHNNRACRQSGKSMAHLQVQLYLKKLREDAVVEKHFSSINRIADVVWEKDKLIFEIQCSPILSREVAARNSDYSMLGYTVIWILHEQTFNQRQWTAAEYFLQDFTHYYTNIDEEGAGCIYDRWDLIKKRIRYSVWNHRPVNLAHFTEWKPLWAEGIYPDWMKTRLKGWKFSFSGDFLDYISQLSEGERRTFLDTQKGSVSFFKPVSISFVRKIFYFISLPYRLYLKLLIEILSVNK